MLQHFKQCAIINNCKGLHYKIVIFVLFSIKFKLFFHGKDDCRKDSICYVGLQMFQNAPRILFSSLMHSPALRGLGTPPTNIVFRGSSGWEPSSTKSLSARFQGRICTCKTSKATWHEFEKHAINKEGSVKLHRKCAKKRYKKASQIRDCRFWKCNLITIIYDTNSYFHYIINPKCFSMKCNCCEII